MFKVLYSGNCVVACYERDTRRAVERVVGLQRMSRYERLLRSCW